MNKSLIDKLQENIRSEKNNKCYKNNTKINSTTCNIDDIIILIRLLLIF